MATLTTGIKLDASFGGTLWVTDDTGLTVSLAESPYTAVIGLAGGAGNDSLTGNGLNNHIWGGIGGADTLNGGGSNNSDTYWWGKYDGNDVITAPTANAADTVQLYNVSLAAVTLVAAGSDLVLNAGSSSLMVKSWMNAASRIGKFAFTDGNVLSGQTGSAADLLVADSTNSFIYGWDGDDSLAGGAGADQLNGGAGADQLWGAAGSDVLSGGDGADTYWWGKNDGLDVIVADASNVADTIRLYDGVKSELTVSLNGSDCVLSLGTAQLTVRNWSTGLLDKVIFADGSVGSLQQLLAATPTATSQTLAIHFDYSLDSSGFFQQNPQAKACLEQAAALWTSKLKDDFAVVPAGTLLNVADPTTGATKTFAATQNIDDIVIFVGAKNLVSATAQGGSSAYYYIGDSLDKRYNSTTNFEPWVGAISFDNSPSFSDGSAAEWWLDPTPATSGDAATDGKGKYDFITVAAHEIGHVLGIAGGIDAYDSEKDTAGNFAGAYAKAANSGKVIPLIDDTHPNGYSGNFAMEVAMAYGGSTYVGHRVVPSAIDFGMLADIGYQVSGVNV